MKRVDTRPAGNAAAVATKMTTKVMKSMKRGRQSVVNKNLTRKARGATLHLTNRSKAIIKQILGSSRDKKTNASSQNELRKSNNDFGLLLSKLTADQINT